MTKPSINPKLFAGQEIKDLKHDDYLLIFNSDGVIIRDLLREYVYDKFLITKKEGEEIDLIKFKKEGEEHLALISYLESDEGKKIKNYKKIKGIRCSIPKFKIDNWSPEHIIKNKGYYIGSIDLYCELNVEIKKIIFYEKEGEWELPSQYKSFKVLFEFKPKINSFSEVIRQIKVYTSYIDLYDVDGIIPICITESPIESFKDIFNQQKILIFNIKDFLNKQLNNDNSSSQLKEELNKSVVEGRN